MPMHDTTARGLELHQAGQLAEAEAIYREILDAEPNNAVVLHLLGVLAIQVGEQQAAIDLISRAVELDPTTAAYQCNLGVAYQNVGRLEDAADWYGRALAVQPDHVDALNNQAIVL